MLRSFVTIFATVILTATSTHVLAASQESADAPLEQGTGADGLEASVARRFSAASNDTTGVLHLEVRIGEFDTEASASSAVAPWFEQLRAANNGYRFDLSQLAPVAVEKVADESRAMIGTAPFREDESITLEVAVLSVRDGESLYTYVAWGRYSTPLDEAVEVAERTLGLEPLEFEPVPDIPYKTGGLWDIAPRIEHVPDGLTWVEDYVPCIGVFASVSCQDPQATPAATPA